ncbi:hypothetical protein RFI_18052 [Reticulomyxa filosa]|uniref:Uncharacterized protein n=1 Tax=Reticulomyxa filosa TaxID=46433 RepID=X6MZC2_RETFI|nr:hypothetical protein RFI_18052 [Reticulomyxa filosa]|eukprot:ETO19181.1 hypothetical protein RFI_18052 [Reticulomyxa filosa]
MSSSEAKVVVVGAGGAGKSALVVRFITDHFHDTYDPTIEDSYRKQISINEEGLVLEVLDTAGQEEFSSFHDAWIRDGNGFILVFSLCDRSTLDSISAFREKILRSKDKTSFPMVVVGTKKDLENERQFSTKEVKDLTDKWGVDYIEASAYTRENVDKCFHDLANQIMQNRNQIADEKATSDWYTFCVGICKEEDATEEKIIELQGDATTANGLRPIAHAYIHVYVFNNMLVTFFFFFFCQTTPFFLEYVLKLKWNRRSRCVNEHTSKTISSEKHLALETQACFFFKKKKKLNKQKKKKKRGNLNDKKKECRNDALTLDLLGALVGRSSKYDPESLKHVDWFLIQSLRQLALRVLLILISTLLYVIIIRNPISQFRNRGTGNGGGEKLSWMETFGPLFLYALLWLVFSVWEGHEFTIKPMLPSLTRLRGLRLYFGEKFDYQCDVYTFLRSYAFSRQSKRNRHFSWFALVYIFSMSLVYGLIPGLVRVSILNTSFFYTDFTLTAGAVVANFLLMAILLMGVEWQYSKNLGNYQKWMETITMLLSRAETSSREELSKLFLSLKLKSNVLGWLELRSFLGVEGVVLFGEQEISTSFLVLLTLAQGIFIFYDAFFVPNHQRQVIRSILFDGISWFFLVSVTCLIRIAIAGKAFENIQDSQEQLIADQHFYLHCDSIRQIPPSQNSRKTQVLAPPQSEESKQLNDKEAIKLLLPSDSHIPRHNIYDLNFVDSMLKTVKRKSLLPKLFGVSLSGVLLSAILSALVSIIITFLKVFLPNSVPI